MYRPHYVPTPEERLRMKTLSTLNVEWLPTIQIKPFERDLRKIPDRGIEVVGDSIKEFGWRQLIVTDKNYVIIVGHVRWLSGRAATLEGDGRTFDQIKAERSQQSTETGTQAQTLGLLDEYSQL